MRSITSHKAVSLLRTAWEASVGAARPTPCRRPPPSRWDPHFADGPPHSQVVIAVIVVEITIVMTAGSHLLALTGDAGERVLVWLGVAFLGIGAAAAVAIRWRQGRKAPIAVKADAQIATTAASSGLPRDVAGRVVEAYYAYLERHPPDRILDVRVERSWIARESGLDADTVRRVLEAHDECLIASGLMSPVKARHPA
jgi:hypothetical protein